MPRREVVERDIVRGDILKRGALARGRRSELLERGARLEGRACSEVWPGRALRRAEGERGRDVLLVGVDGRCGSASSWGDRAGWGGRRVRDGGSGGWFGRWEISVG